MRTLRDIELSAPVFRVIPDPFSYDWCIEMRDSSIPEALWAIIPEKPEMDIQYLRLSQSWSYCLQDFAGGEMVLGTYEASGMPVISGLQAYDSFMHRIWQHTEAKHLQRKNSTWHFEKFSDSLSEPLRSPNLQETLPCLSPTLIIPEIIVKTSRVFEEHKPLKQLEYLQADGLQYVSFFEQNPNPAYLKQWLMVYRGDEIIFREIIQKNAKGFSLDTWCLRNGVLYFLEENARWKAMKFL